MTKMNTLISKALSLGMTEAAAKRLIKKHDIRSTAALLRIAKAQAETPRAVLVDPNISTRSMPRELAKQVLKQSPVRLRGRSGVKLPGPRGYRFGPVWLKSIAEGRGIATHPSNLPKLLATAASRRVNIPKDMPQEEIVRLVAKELTS